MNQDEFIELRDLGKQMEKGRKETNSKAKKELGYMWQAAKDLGGFAVKGVKKAVPHLKTLGQAATKELGHADKFMNPDKYQKKEEKKKPEGFDFF